MRKCQYRLINPLSFNSSRHRAKWFEELYLICFAFKNKVCFSLKSLNRKKTKVIDLPNLNFNPGSGQIFFRSFSVHFLKKIFNFRNSSYFNFQLFIKYDIEQKFLKLLRFWDLQKWKLHQWKPCKWWTPCVCILWMKRPFLTFACHFFPIMQNKNALSFFPLKTVTHG